MTIVQLFEKNKSEIIAEAVEGMKRSKLKHYSGAGLPRIHERITLLFELTLECIKTRQLIPIIHHADKIARERFSAGYDLHEVQTAFNILEEELWNQVIKNMSPARQAEALGMVSTVLGAGKEKLALTYVSLSSKTPATSLDLHSHFGGTK